jgi:hypothetical protein
MNLVERLKAARRVAVPIVAVESPDPAETIRTVRAAFENGAKTPIPIVQWDAMNGLAGLNAAGAEALAAVLTSTDPDSGVTSTPPQDQWPALTANPGAALALMAQLPGELFSGKELSQRGTIAFMLNAHRYFQDQPGVQNGQVVQGIWNLRDAFKSNRRTLVPIVAPGARLPAELAQDVVVFDEPYPDDEALKAVVAEQTKAAPLAQAALEGAVDALRGLSAFAAEQVTAMSLTKDGLDVGELWERKVKVIEATDGFTVYKGAETFDDVRGAANFTDFAGRLIRSKRSPTLYVQIDEIEKSFAGLGNRGGAGDNTGITQDRLRTMLTYMEDEGWTGLILLGHAGCGKSLLTKALANTASRVTGRRILSLALDLEATSSSAAGEAGRRMRAAMKLIKSLAAGGRVCFVATCNGVDELPPALKRRFKLGTWMADLPERAEKDAMWEMNLAKYGLDKRSLTTVNGKKTLARPDDTDWTGADIRNVCDTADNLECTLEEACQFTTFIARSDPDAVSKLRRFADGKLVSISRPGAYRAPFTDKPFTGGQPAAARRAQRAEED